MNKITWILILILASVVFSSSCTASIAERDTVAAQSANPLLFENAACDHFDSSGQKGDLIACNNFGDSVVGDGQGYSFWVEEGKLEVSVSRPYTPISIPLSDDVEGGVSAVIDVYTTEIHLGTGLICSYQDPDHYYAFLFTEDGGYGIAKKSPEKLEYLANGIVSLTPNSNAVRQVEIHCQKGVLSLYVDGFYVNSVYDTEYLFGRTGLFIQSFDDDSNNAIFDNFASFVSSP